MIVFLFLFFPITTFSAYLPPTKGSAGMVATAQHLATQVGISILKKGGNAIDAAVAVGYVLAVVQPCCGNIGGGGFMLIHLSNGNNVFIDFREKAPAIIPKKLNPNITRGYLPIGIPGTVMGLNRALKMYGTMTLKQVMTPAITLAKKGFILTKNDTAFLDDDIKVFKKSPNVSAIFLKNGKPYKSGDRLIQKDLAKSLEEISKDGTNTFYHGRIAREIAAASKVHGGTITREDLASYTIVITNPIRCQYRGYQIITAPPPGSGVTVCEILNIINGYSIGALGFHSAATTHYNIEAFRYGFADRNQYLGDPAFVNNPVEKLLSTDYANQIRSKINPVKAGSSEKLRNFMKPHNTTHFVVIDKQGNAVSLTSTLNRFFGSGVIAGNTGFFLNDELNDFTLKNGVANLYKLKQGKANLIKPNKRPLSCMSPTFIMDNNKLYLALGAAGGPTIITSIVEIIENVLDFDMDVNTAINMPRYHMQWLPDIVFIEPFAFSQDTLKVLHKMGYKTQRGFYGETVWGQAAAALINSSTNFRYGAADNGRPGGSAIGLNKVVSISKPK